MLELINVSLSVSEGETRKEILKNVNLVLEEGQLYGITGPNGGGKTSMAKVMMGIYQPEQGQVLFNGQEITNLSITERAQLGIAYAFQAPPRFKGLRVMDVMAIANPAYAEMQSRGILRDVGLCPEDYVDRDMGPGLSGGEIKRIEVAQILARQPRLALFDEPEAGVDLWTIQKLISIILRNYKDHPGRTAAVITHNPQFLPVCDQIIMVADGKIQAVGSTNEIWPLIKDDIMCCGAGDCCGEGQLCI
ncbi:MAG: ABC transporter ATP-binding protein [Methylocystaceae bacterium]